MSNKILYVIIVLLIVIIVGGGMFFLGSKNVQKEGDSNQQVTASPLPSNNNVSPSIGSSCVIKGNINSSGEKIYHLPTCGSYAKTQIDLARGEKWFCSEAEAQTAGWRKALNCP